MSGMQLVSLVFWILVVMLAIMYVGHVYMEYFMYIVFFTIGFIIANVLRGPEWEMVIMEREEFAELVDTSVKNIHPFEIESPQGRQVQGYICKSRGGHMGSLMITQVDKEMVEQYVQGMPKITYPDMRHELELPTVRLKEDGTNILMYPLKNQKGEIVEVLMKTRLMPELSGKFYDMAFEAYTGGMINAVTQTGFSMAYELIGGENLHEIDYRFLGDEFENVQLVGLCAFHSEGDLVESTLFDALCHVHKIPRAMEVFKIMPLDGGYGALPTADFLDRYDSWVKMDEDAPSADDLRALYKEMEVYFEKINMNFQKENPGKIIIEGAVWQSGRTLNKCKAISVREGHIKQACGIPTHDIRKALNKLKENSYEDLAEIPIEYVIAFVKEELSEEYPEPLLKDSNTEQKIKSTFGKFIKKVDMTEELEQICARVNQEVGEDAEVTLKMQTYAKLYPDGKRLSGKVYQAFTATRS